MNTSKLKEFDMQSLLSENTNLKTLVTSLQSEKTLEIQVLKAQNKEYCDILNNVQSKTNKSILEMQQAWEKKCFLLENKNKKLEVDLEKTQKQLEALQNTIREQDLFKLRDNEKNRVWNEEIKAKEQEGKKWREKYGISEERVKDMILQNEYLFNEMQKFKNEAEVAELKTENYLSEFQRKINILENEYNKANANIVKLEREKEGKQGKIDQLQSEVLAFKERYETLLENSHNEINQRMKDYDQNLLILRKKNEFLSEENENLKALNRKSQEEIEDIQAYYGNLMGSLQDNIRHNIKETLSNSHFSTPIRKENLSDKNDGNSFRNDSGDISLKFIHKYQ